MKGNLTVNANQIARGAAARRNQHAPAPTMQEKAWRQKYNVALLDRGVPLDYVMGLDPPIDLAADPVACAEEEIWCMEQDDLNAHDPR